jgi:hypothetical protein
LAWCNIKYIRAVQKPKQSQIGKDSTIGSSSASSTLLLRANQVHNLKLGLGLAGDVEGSLKSGQQATGMLTGNGTG